MKTKRYSINFPRLVLLIALMALSYSSYAQFYYGIRQDYGKNRVQFNDFDWVFYRFERFDVYFYRGNDELAAQVARMTDEQLPQVEGLLDAALDERVQILIFNNLSDLKQSNVNTSDEEEYNTGGVTRISGRRVFLYFEGSYTKLENDLKARLAEVVLSNLAYGSFTQSIRNSALLNLPEWYTEGLISYIGYNDDPTVKTMIRDAYLTRKFRNINNLTGDDARHAGHSLWDYIVSTYGKKVVKNVLYMAIVNRNIESGFLYILGKDIKTIEKDWKAYLQDKYSKNSKLDQFEKKSFVKARKHHLVTHMEASPDGRYLAYVTQRFGRYKLYTYDFQKEKKKRLLTQGYRIAQNADYSYPLLAWNPNGKILAMITEEKGFIWLSYYNFEDRKWQKQKFFKFDKILSFQYSGDGKRFVMSAVKDGQSDIFVYTILNTKVEQLTNDTYDDLEPAFIMGDRRVVWSSNRVGDSLIDNLEATDFPKHKHDIYSMPAYEPEDTVSIWQLTNTMGIDERSPQAYYENYIGFLSDRQGIVNRHLLAIDSAVSYVDTTTHYQYSFKEYAVSNYQRSILGESYLPERGLIADKVFFNDRYRIYLHPFETPEELQLVEVEADQTEAARPTPTGEDRSGFIPSNSTSVPLYYPGVRPSGFEVNIYNYDFGIEGQNDPRNKRSKPQPKKVPLLPQPTALADLAVEPDEQELDIPPKRNYFLSFFQDDFTVRFDNMFDLPQYQRFTGVVTSDYLNAGFNTQFKAGVMDLMHDYRVVAGMRTGFQPLNGTSIAPNATFLVGLGDYKERIDKEYTYSRSSRILNPGFDYIRIITHQITGKFSYPFNPVASLRFTAGYRLDQGILLARDNFSTFLPNSYEDFIIGKLSYVYDNTRKLGVNLYSGLRYKLFTEYYRNLFMKPTGLHTAGIDLRNYTIIHRNFIWANRFAAGTSFGPEKLIYIMGGVDNAFNPQTDPTTPIAYENNYIYQTLVTNMRGFYQNVRNGNSFAVINSELRLPFFSYLIRRPIRSDFIKNFQLIGFGDIGTAWNGISPYAEENAINTRIVPYGDAESGSRIVLDSQKEPIVGSYGIGARTRLFGYFLRFDWAWPIEDGIMLPRQFTFSIGTDF